MRDLEPLREPEREPFLEPFLEPLGEPGLESVWLSEAGAELDRLRVERRVGTAPDLVGFCLLVARGHSFPTFPMWYMPVPAFSLVVHEWHNFAA